MTSFGFIAQLPLVYQVLIVLLILVSAVFVFGFPREIFMVYAGFQFGVIVGGLTNLLGLLGGAAVGYVIGRLGKYPGGHPKLEHFLEENGVRALFVIRITPLSPHDSVSMISGYLKLRYAGYLVASALAFLPYAVFWSYVGLQSTEVVERLEGTSVDVVQKLLFFLLPITFLLIYLRRRSGDQSDEPSMSPAGRAR